MAQALTHNAVMYHNHHNPQQAHFMQHPQAPFYPAYPHYDIASGSIAAPSYIAPTYNTVGMDMVGLGVGPAHPTGVDRTARMDRRRPKYTRSKLGCLTCRRKKVKCDEAKPTCTRCSNSGVGCTWPEAPPPKKKASSSRSTSKRATDSPVSPTDPISSSTSVSNLDFSKNDASDEETSRPATATLGGEIKQEDGEEGSTPHAQFLTANPSERRHSEPHFSGLAPPVSGVAIADGRRHSTMDILPTQQSQQQAENMYSASALGLTLNQLHTQDQIKPEGQTPALSYSSLASNSRAESRNGSRPATPNDFYGQQQNLGGPSAMFAQTGSNGWSLGINVPQCTSTANSSRPSTASSLSLSHVQALRRGSATSFGTGGGSPPTTGGSAQCIQNSPFSYQLPQAQNAKQYGDISSARSSIDMTGAPSGGPGLLAGMMPTGAYTSISRPSTANSMFPNAGPTESPYVRHGSFDGRVHVPSPLPNQSSSPLAQPQPSHSQQSYFAQLNQFPNGNMSRPESPYGTRTTY